MTPKPEPTGLEGVKAESGSTMRHEIVKSWTAGASSGATCSCGRKGTIPEIQEHIVLREQEGDEVV